MVVVVKGSVLKSIRPHRVIPLSDDDFSLLERRLSRFSEVQPPWKLHDWKVSPIQGDDDDASQYLRFVKKVISRGTIAAFTLLMALGSINNSVQMEKMTNWATDDNDAFFASDEEDLLTEGYTFIQRRIDWPLWLAHYAYVRENMIVVSISHPLVQYAKRILPQLDPSLWKDTQRFLETAQLVPTPKKPSSGTLLRLTQLIQDHCHAILVAVLPFAPSPRRTNQEEPTPEWARKRLKRVPCNDPVACLPNVAWDWDPPTGELRLVALYDLEPDEDWMVGTSEKNLANGQQIGTSKAPAPDEGNYKTCSPLHNAMRLGHYSFQNNQHDQAIQYYRRAIEASHDSGPAIDSIWHAIGAVMLAKGRFIQAQRHWFDAVQKHNHLLKHEGVALQIQKQKAYRYLEQAEQNTLSCDAVSSTQPPPKNGVEYTSYFDDLCFVTDHPLVSSEQCERILHWAETHGNWTTSRHYAVPTHDVPVHTVPLLLEWFRDWMKVTVSPLLCRQFRLPYHPSFFVHDAFVVRYGATDASRFLPIHVDESTHSFVLALNKDFEGGGTYFYDWDTTLVPSEPGVMVSFCGDRVRHGGNVVTQGTRYILAVFLYWDLPRRKRLATTTALKEAKKAKFSFGFSL